MRENLNYVVFFVASFLEAAPMECNDTFLIGQAHERFNFKVKLEYGASIQLLFDNAVQTDYFYKIIVANQHGIFIDLRHINYVQLIFNYNYNCEFNKFMSNVI